MKPLLWIFGSMIAYAIFNLLVERHLLKVHALVTMTVGSAIVVVLGILAIVLCKATGLAKIDMPNQAELYALTICGFLLFAAEFSYVSAYTSGGKLIAITTAIALIPVVASAFKIITGGKSPSWLEMLSWAIIAGGLVLWVSAQSEENSPKPPQ